MYTELHLNVELKRDVPEAVIAVLRHMVDGNGGDESALPLPEHPLFGTERWQYMLRCDSYYFADFLAQFVARYDWVNDAAYAFATVSDLPVDLLAGNDGALYVLTRNSIVRFSSP